MLRYVILLVAGVALASSAGSVPNVMLFYESLCPYCMEEMSGDIPEAVRKFGGDIFISLVPYGNADLTIGQDDALRIECQHGADECTGNLWHACSHIYMKPKERLQYAMCTMTHGDEMISYLKKCTTPAMAAQLEKCATTPQGTSAVKLMADITYMAGAVVNPNGTRRLNGVPSIFIDGYPVSGFDQQNHSLVELICLKALHKPPQCGS